MNNNDTRALSLGAIAVAIVSLFVVGAVALTQDEGSAAPAGPALERVSVTLSEWAITPAELHLPPEGAVLVIANAGSMNHNLKIDGLGVDTPEIAPGDTLEVTVGASAESTYAMWCNIAGHRESGMEGIVMVGAAHSEGHTMTWQEMDEVMRDVALQFPAETAGHGGERLEPTVLSDGTKQFDITVQIVDWEVSPGKIVKAWTYNGVVPAPEIKVDVGDKIRIVMKNDLPESTAMHFHGIRVPNSMDGVPPYTQDFVTPGSTFTYEFTALEPAVGIYHSHHNAQVQVPNGMFGAFIIGEYEIPDVLKEKGYTQIDKTVNMVLNDAGTIGLSLNGKSFPATEAYTLKIGEVMMVHYFNEGLLGHPMHLHQPSGWIIAKDGTPMLVPIPGDTIWIGPGERYTVIYKAVDPGVWAWHCHILSHAEGSEGMFGMVTALIVE